MIPRSHPYFFIAPGPREKMARDIADRFVDLIERRRARGSISCALACTELAQVDLVAPLSSGSPADKLIRSSIANSRQQSSVAQIATGDGEMAKKRKRRMPGTTPGRMEAVWKRGGPKGPTYLSHAAPRSRRR